jgi:NTP pyrophosphatase (non-canonical NTP hydrolase)
MNWGQLITERDEWIAHNFPNHALDEPVDESLVGVMEEKGELAHAHLKAAQKIRGSEEEHIANAKDAIGDLTIYLLGVISRIGQGFEDEGISPERQASTPTWALKYLDFFAGRLSISPDLHTCYRIVGCLVTYCDFMDWDYEEIVMSTWNEVKQRDWQKNKEDGGVPDRSMSDGEAPHIHEGARDVL